MSTKLSKPTIALHWLTALTFLAVLGMGLYISDLPRTPEKFELLAIHKSLGLLVLVVAAVRVVWRLKEGKLSALSALPRWQEISASAVHGLLLVATLLMPVSGLIMNIAGGRATEFFGLVLLSGGEKSETLASIGSWIHHSSINVIIAVLVLHVLAALKHQFVDKDGMISRMLGRVP
ncbi:cytochrome b [Alginatibacterium sediminis]|uniref:Cytochrome b n=1 Tax=Alginatibacterium sediminis TaxID=2164068 RepID=A0A420EH55_9ALTE|nr:cytochrome b [Alginatibacterium sediminis]RKF20000.1 cytochrome b [Alginatibacterium sediminis]